MPQGACLTETSSHEIASAIFNSANFSSIATDVDGVIQIFNVGAERMLGYTAAEVLNKVTPADISDPQELILRAAALSVELGTTIAPGFEALVSKAARGIEDFYELTYIRKDRSRLPAVVSVTALRDAQTTIIGYLLIGTDNTARKLIEEERTTLDHRLRELKSYEHALRQKNRELEDASRMKSEFLTNMSHELRTPLTAVIGFSEVLRDGAMGELTTTQQECVGDIYSGGKHLLALINDILDLSKAEAGQMTLNLEPIDAAALLRNSLSIVRDKAAARLIELEIDAGTDLGSMQADARKVRQIVDNLLFNAVKFTGEGGRVTLHASRVPRADVGQLSGSRRSRSLAFVDGDFDTFLKISVADTGIGISAMGLDQLFTRFGRVHGGAAREFEGTGLGLAMVKQLVELHGGVVAVESAAGQGSCFVVWLPMRTPVETAVIPANAANAGSDMATASALLTAQTVLVVDDDEKAVELTALRLVDSLPLNVSRASNGLDAIAKARQERPDLIVLDLMMPGMDGFEVLGALRADPATGAIPILVVTAKQITDEDRGKLTDSKTTIMKKAEFDREEFIVVARRLLSRDQAGVR